MIISRTLIVYQYPEALPDVYRWAIEQKVELKGESPVFLVVKEEEIIDIMPIHSAMNHRDRIDKLVLWGAFTKDDLYMLYCLMRDQGRNQ